MNFVGKAEKLQPSDIEEVAHNLGVEVAALRAVLAVETGGRGFDDAHRPKALFERHHFYKHLANHLDLQAEAVELGLAYAKWGEKPYPRKSDGVYAEIEAACKLDETAALLSTSWGLGQIMGSNFKLAGCTSVAQMVEEAKESEANQLRHMAAFIHSSGLLDELTSKDWAKFARGYNGPGYATNKYDVKLAEAYEQFA
jgi:hypothetical protein